MRGTAAARVTTIVTATSTRFVPVSKCVPQTRSSSSARVRGADGLAAGQDLRHPGQRLRQGVDHQDREPAPVQRPSRPSTKADRRHQGHQRQERNERQQQRQTGGHQERIDHSGPHPRRGRPGCRRRRRRRDNRPRPRRAVDAATVPAAVIANPGVRQVMLRSSDGKLYSNALSFSVAAAPTPNYSYIGIIGTQRYILDTAILQDKGSKDTLNVQRGDLLAGRFRVTSISEKEVVVVDNNLKIKHTLPMSAQGDKGGPLQRPTPKVESDDDEP